MSGWADTALALGVVGLALAFLGRVAWRKLQRFRAPRKDSVTVTLNGRY